MGLYTLCCRAVCAYVGLTVALQIVGFAIYAGTYYENHEEDFKHARAVVHKYQSGTKIAFQQTKFAIDNGAKMINRLETVTKKDTKLFPSWVMKGIETHKTKSVFTGKSMFSKESLDNWKPGDVAKVSLAAKTKNGKVSAMTFSYEPIKLEKVPGNVNVDLQDKVQYVELHTKNYNGIYKKKYASSLCVLVDQTKEGAWALKEKDALGGFGCNANKTFDAVKTYDDLPAWEKKAPTPYDDHSHKNAHLPVEVRYAREPTTYLTRHYSVFGTVKSYFYLHPLLILGITTLALLCVCFGWKNYYHPHRRAHPHLPTVIAKSKQQAKPATIMAEHTYGGEDDKEAHV